MPNIKPSSDLRNYTTVIEVKESDDLDKQKSLNQLMAKLNDAEKSIQNGSTVSADELEAELRV